MASRDDYIKLVQQAQLGDEECLNQLADVSSERLRMYIYRATLDHEKTEDIVQESMLEMFKVLGKLRETDRFWPWLYRIAANKIHRHKWTEKREGGVAAAKLTYDKEPEEKQVVLENLVSQELREIVSSAMRTLKTQHREILAMRCYDEMPYSDIALVMGCSEFAARKMFCRAKRSLEKQLARRGLGKGMLLTSLVVFGKLTASSEAAAANVSVAVASLKVGAAAGVAVLATSKAVVVPVVTVGALAVGTMVATTGPEKTSAVPMEDLAKSPYITTHRVQAGKSNAERWYYYPPNANGAVMIRFKLDEGGRQSYCQWLQNDQANYYKHKNAIYINNYRMWADDLSVLRLPTDKPELTDFISQVEGKANSLEYVKHNGGGLLVTVTRDENAGFSQIAHHHDASGEEHFRYNWLGGTEAIDNRDAMHKRGWTYFRIKGQIGNEEVSGLGRIPFVYQAAQLYPPWLRLKVGDKEFVDAGGEVLFKGLSRPWMGLHTIDTVRRDAAEQRMWFETRLTGGNNAEVKVSSGEEKIVYTIDMARDVVEKIRISGGGVEGEIRFEYLEEVSGAGKEFARPRGPYRGRQEKSIGIRWLMRLTTD